ncbi:MAG: NAD(P)/FAD-dependent oxidoreductase [Acidobacteria bacterium]|nr:NAD(P)/FAD-dependent oxidoreductase [Acidobacteriota bacterium]
MKRILVLGAGFGGLQATIDLDRIFRREREIEILLVSEQNLFLFTPLLPEIASSYINPRHIVQAVRDIRGRRRFGFQRELVRAIDVSRRQVELASGTLSYDSLVVALGSRTDYLGVPGAREHTWDFKTLEDAVVLRERILDLCEHADHTADEAVRRQMMTFVIVGAGYTGVELVSEMHDFLFHYVVGRYRGISPAEIRLIVVEDAQEILRGVHPKLAKHAKKRLQVEGIEIRLGARATRCFPGGVEVNSSQIIPAETVVWAAGVRAHELVEALPGPHDRIGRAIVNEHLQLETHPEIFVVGDSAAAVTAPEAPRVAPVAIAHGRLAARNIAHLEKGEPLESYRYTSQGILISLGMNYAVVDIWGLKFSGYFAWLLWNAVHLFKLAGLKKQLQVAIDWWLAVVFPRDASIVRRPRRCKLCGTDAAQ